MRLEPAAPRSRVQHTTTELPPKSHDLAHIAFSMELQEQQNHVKASLRSGLYWILVA